VIRERRTAGRTKIARAKIAQAVHQDHEPTVSQATGAGATAQRSRAPR
jgi:hypothetical protein